MNGEAGPKVGPAVVPTTSSEDTASIEFNGIDKLVAKYIADTSRAIGWECCAVALNVAGRDVARKATELGIWQHPRYAEIEARRVPHDRPCPRHCNRCSTCTRAAAIVRNRQQFGHDDYPGLDVLGGVA